MKSIESSTDILDVINEEIHSILANQTTNNMQVDFANTENGERDITNEDIQIRTATIGTDQTKIIYMQKMTDVRG